MTRSEPLATKKLRVALVHWAMPPTTGGVESHVADLALTLAELGCAVTVLTGEPQPVPILGVRINYLPCLDLSLNHEKDPDNACVVELTRSLREVLSEQRFDVVHGHNLHHFSAAPALALHKLRDELGFQLYHTFHETWPDVLHRHPIYRQWHNYAVSKFVQSECHSRIGFLPELMPLGIDAIRFSPKRLTMEKEKPYVVLHPARVLPWKGVHVSVEMVAELKRRNVAVKLIITDTNRIIDWNDELVSYRKEILQRLGSDDLAKFVEFRTVTYTQMPELYEEADVVVYPTIGDEPYGLVPLEAMSMARPVVGARSGGICETIVEGVTGFLVERGDPLALADRVQTLLQSPEMCREMGAAGRRHVVANYNGRNYAASLLASYLETSGMISISR